MAIITSRTNENGKITILYDRCNSCGLCVKVCKDFSLKMVDNMPVVSNNPVFGCIACGHCMAICPENAIEISGREMSAADLVDLTETKNKPSYDQMKNLLIGRRSIRDFKDKDIVDDLIESIHPIKYDFIFYKNPDTFVVKKNHGQEREDVFVSGSVENIGIDT